MDDYGDPFLRWSEENAANDDGRAVVESERRADETDEEHIRRVIAGSLPAGWWEPNRNGLTCRSAGSDTPIVSMWPHHVVRCQTIRELCATIVHEEETDADTPIPFALYVPTALGTQLLMAAFTMYRVAGLPNGLELVELTVTGPGGSVEAVGRFPSVAGNYPDAPGATDGQ